MTDQTPTVTDTTNTVTNLPAPTPRHGPAKTCPRHGAILDGGPVLFHCPAGEHSVFAADLPHESTRPLVPMGRAA